MRDLWCRNAVEIQVKLEDRDAGDISRDWRMSVVNAAESDRTSQTSPTEGRKRN